MSIENKRIYYIDIARAVAIIFIVLGHTLRGASIYYWLYSFHVPLCVIITGLTFSTTGKSFKEFAKKRIRTLLIPYYVFSLLSIAIYYVLGSRVETMVGGQQGDSIGMNICGMLWGNGENGLMRWNLPLWYLPMIFSAELMAFCIFKRFRISSLKRGILVTVTAIILAGVIYYLDFLHDLPFSFETTLYLFPFLTFGMTLKYGLDKLENLSKAKMILAGFTLVIMGTLLQLQCRNVDYVCDSYGNYWIFITVAILISSGIIMMCTAWNTKNKLAVVVGQNTLGIMLMHKFPIMFFVSVLPFTRNLITQIPLLSSIVYTICTIVMCIVATEILTYICPWAVGKRRSHSAFGK